MDGVVRWAPVLATAILLVIGLARAAKQRRRGVRVVIVDLHRTPLQKLTDSLLLLGLFGGLGLNLVACLVELPPPWSQVLFGQVAAQALGLLVLAGADVIYAVALLHLGDAWRIGFDQDTPGPLATRGIYRFMRHPIYVGLDALAVGALLLQGRLVFLLTALSVTVSMHVQMRREERWLAETFGDAYLAYQAQVGRYCTIVRRRQSA